jgi:PAS domain-containing protein
MTSALEAPQTSLDLDALESDSAPIFVIKIGQGVLKFEFIFCNEAFRHSGFRERIAEQSRPALLFRSWAQALGAYKPQHDFQERRWTSNEAGKDRTWRVIRVTEVLQREAIIGRDRVLDVNKEAIVKPDVGNWGRVYCRSKDEIMQEMKANKSVLLKTLPQTDLTARWERLQTMMEMSDVGVFEYNAEGKLIHANEAWYRLRYNI